MKRHFVLWALVLGAAGCGSSYTFTDGDDASVADSSTVDPDASDAPPAETKTCTTDSECASLLASVTPTPEGCAEAFCDKTSGSCGLRAIDKDGDGYRTAKCDVPGFAGFVKGNDCDDANKDFHPGKDRDCSAKPDGTKITYPGGKPQGECRYGKELCKADGTLGACEGAVAPADKIDCSSDKDRTCVGKPDASQCGCKLDTTQECYEGPSGTAGVGACKKGTQTCIKDPADPLKTVWGPCKDQVVPAAKDSCATKGADETCDGVPNKDCVCVAGDVQSCGTCLDGKQTCNSSGEWGTCTGARTDVGNPCGKCGGTIKCDGTCSIATPWNHGASCGSCGGTVKCDGSCSVATPWNYGSSCGSCGGKVLCDGSCSVSTPWNYGTSCGSCGGKIACDGKCSIATPWNYGTSCGSCGGTVKCDGSCSVATPWNYGHGCGNCGGTITCSGTCSKASISPAPGTISTKYTANGSFSCCWINEDRYYGGSCDANHVFYDCTVTKTGGGGKVYVKSTGSGTSCTCTVHVENVGTEGATYTVAIRQIAKCP